VDVNPWTSYRKDHGVPFHIKDRPLPFHRPPLHLIIGGVGSVGFLVPPVLERKRPILYLEHTIVYTIDYTSLIIIGLRLLTYV